jgi:regulator of ribosome biosynthesis
MPKKEVEDYPFEKPEGEGKVMTAEEAEKEPSRNPTGMRPDHTQGDYGLNRHMDIGSLVVEDTQSYDGISMKEFSKRTASSLCQLYKALFEIKKK